MNRFIGWMAANESSILFFINQQLRCRVLDVTLPKITHLGGATATIASMLAMLLFAGNLYRGWALQALLSLTLSHIVVQFLKKHYRRERPYIALSTVNLSANPLKDYSFPSGHTTAVFSIAMTLALHSLLLAVLLIPLAIIVGVSRIYLGLHYPTDCIIGALLGTISSLAVVLGAALFFI